MSVLALVLLVVLVPMPVLVMELVLRVLLVVEHVLVHTTIVAMVVVVFMFISWGPRPVPLSRREPLGFVAWDSVQIVGNRLQMRELTGGIRPIEGQ